MDQVRIAGRSSATATLGASETAGTATKGEPAGDSMNPTTIARGATHRLEAPQKTKYDKILSKTPPEHITPAAY